MKNKIFIVISLVLLLLFLGVLLNNKKTNNVESWKIKVITTLFPTYDFARAIAGDKAEISLILDPGIEAHSFEPTPKDIVEISKSSLFIYTGEDMEPWVKKIKNSIKSENLYILDSSMGVIKEEDEDHHEAGEHKHHHDPHIWTDPIQVKIMVNNILKAFISIDKENADFYKKNAEEYLKELDNLDKEIRTSLSKTKYKKIFTGGHFVFKYFVKRYNLEYSSPYNGFAPNAEPKAKDIVRLKESIIKSGIKYIYFEELINPKLAKILSDETGVKLLLLHGMHNVSKKELKDGLTYIKLMKNNLENLKLGLEYSE